MDLLNSVNQIGIVTILFMLWKIDRRLVRVETMMPKRKGDDHD